MLNQTAQLGEALALERRCRKNRTWDFAKMMSVWENLNESLKRKSNSQTLLPFPRQGRRRKRYIGSFSLESTSMDAINLGLKDLSQLSIPAGCSALNLHGNFLTSLAGLKDAHCIVELNLSSNSFQSLDMPDLAFLSGLQVLDLSSNSISTLLNAPFLPGVMHLSVSYNNLISLAGIGENFPDLEVLDARGNYLADSMAINELASLESLECLFLGGGLAPNPVSLNTDALLSVFNECHTLKTIDGLDRQAWEDLANRERALKKPLKMTSTRDTATSPLPNSNGNIDTQSSIAPTESMPELETPRFDILAQRFRAKTVERTIPNVADAKSDLAEESAFSLESNDSSNSTVEIVDVFLRDISSQKSTPRPSPSPSPSPLSRNGKHNHMIIEQEVDPEEVSPNPRSVQYLSAQHRNPWEGPTLGMQSVRGTSKSVDHAIDPALAADMRSLIGALRLSGIPESSPSVHTELPIEQAADKHEPFTEKASASAELVSTVERQELEGLRMQVAHLETIISDMSLSTIAADEASATALREMESKKCIAEEDSRIECIRADAALDSVRKTELEMQLLRSELAAKVEEIDSLSTRASRLDQQNNALEMFFNEERQKSMFAQVLEKQALVARFEETASEFNDISEKYTNLAADNTALLTRNNELQRLLAFATEREAQQAHRIGSLSAEVAKLAEDNGQLRATASATSREIESIQKSSDSRVRDWERILSGHADMLTNERERFSKLSHDENVIREQHQKLGRRFKQLESAFEQALLRSEGLSGELAAERSASASSRETITELGDGIRKLQAALHRASDYKRSALQLKQALTQAHAENESLVLQVNQAKHVADRIRGEALASVNHKLTTALISSPESVSANEYKRQNEDLESKLRVKTDLLEKAVGLTELLTRKVEDLTHTVQVKDVVLKDQSDSIAALKERIHGVEVESINAENIIIGLEEQLDDARREIEDLGRYAEEQSQAEMQLRSVVADYRSAVRSQLAEVDSESEDSDVD